jgi:hypothetical protein
LTCGSWPLRAIVATGCIIGPGLVPVKAIVCDLLVGPGLTHPRRWKTRCWLRDPWIDPQIGTALPFPRRSAWRAADKTCEVGNSLAALEPSLRVERCLFEGTRRIPVQHDPHGLRGQESRDAERLPLNDMDELVKMNRLCRMPAIQGCSNAAARSRPSASNLSHWSQPTPKHASRGASRSTSPLLAMHSGASPAVPASLPHSQGRLFAHEHDLTYHASLRQKLMRASCLGKRKALRDERLDLLLLKEVEQGGQILSELSRLQPLERLDAVRNDPFPAGEEPPASDVQHVDGEPMKAITAA